MKPEDRLFKTLPPAPIRKSERRQQQILEAAIKSYARIGIEKTTLNKLAKICGISRPLIIHYFVNSDKLAEAVIHHIRRSFQEDAIKPLRHSNDPEEQLVGYVKATFQWVEAKREHAVVWLFFFYYCGVSAKFRKMNTALVQTGTDRVTQMVENLGYLKGAKARRVAKDIQNFIAGWLVAAVTENGGEPLAEVAGRVSRLCLEMARRGDPKASE